jgi:DNA-binding CsgD family transcriptional regulator
MATQTLSAREIEIAGLVAKGMTNEAIACMLGLSLQTVKNHLRTIFRKLNVSNRVQLTVTVLHRAALEPELFGATGSDN